jgi:hypothetical protein
MAKRYFTSLLFVLGLMGCSHIHQDAESLKLGYKQSASDTVIYTSVVQILQNTRRNLPADVQLVVLQGRVLLVGYVSTAQEHIQVINAIWQIKGVHEVIDHLEHVSSDNKKGFGLKNAFIKTQLDANLLTNPSLKYGDFKYIIFKDNLYALACITSEKQKNDFFNLIRKTPSIQKVFFYDMHRQ